MANEITMYQVDAFTGSLFKGNPAAVVPLEAPLSESLMQSIAAENNLAETAFFYPSKGDGLDCGSYHLRWFTPVTEVPLCGHATLASAHVVFEYLASDLSEITFSSASGPLIVSKQPAGLTLDFPRIGYEVVDAPESVSSALGCTIKECYVSDTESNLLVVLDSESALKSLAPDFKTLMKYEGAGVIVTAQSDDPEVDFVSRYFAPNVGIDEDPVTGSNHCVLTPYWFARLGKSQLRARQISQRTGELTCVLNGDRVLISGQAVTYMQGVIFLPE